jgi:hypothetical protein
VAFCGFAICGPNFLRFADLKLPQVRNETNSFLKNKANNAPFLRKIKNGFKKATFRTVLSCAVFCRRICDLRINHENLQIYDLGTGKWHTKEICGFALNE